MELTFKVSGCISGSSGFVLVTDVEDSENNLWIPLEEVDLLIKDLLTMKKQVEDTL